MGPSGVHAAINFRRDRARRAYVSRLSRMHHSLNTVSRLERRVLRACASISVYLCVCVCACLLRVYVCTLSSAMFGRGRAISAIPTFPLKILRRGGGVRAPSKALPPSPRGFIRAQ